MWPFRRKDAVPVSTKSASFLLGMGAWRATLTNSNYDLLAGEGYAINAVVNACVNRIASSIASVEWQLYKRNKGKLDHIEQHDLLDLIESPNPGQSGKEFIRYLVSYYLVSGNAYVFGNGIDPFARKSKPPIQLQLLNPGKVKVREGKDIFPLAYDHRPTAATSIEYPVDQVSGKSAVMQFKTFNPLSPWYGLSPMIAAAFGIDIHNGGQKWNKRLLDNDARPSGALTVKDGEGKPATLTDEQYQRLKEMIDSQYSGADNSGRPMLLEGGLEWQQLSISTKDMDFLNGKHSAARDIGLVFGVPPQLLGIPGDSTFANYEQAMLSFWTDTIIPLLCWFLEGFNRWLVPLYGEDLYLWYDEDSINALEPRRREKATRVNESGYMTINEKRRAMGLDDIEGGDTLFVPATNLPLGLAADPATPDPAAAAKHNKWLQSLGFPAERAERIANETYGG